MRRLAAVAVLAVAVCGCGGSRPHPQRVVSRAPAGRSAVLGSLRSGAFPREMSLEPGGDTLLVTNFASGQLEAVDVGELNGRG